jgi:hypothetical protein
MTVNNSAVESKRSMSDWVQKGVHAMMLLVQNDVVPPLRGFRNGSGAEITRALRTCSSIRIAAFELRFQPCHEGTFVVAQPWARNAMSSLMSALASFMRNLVKVLRARLTSKRPLFSAALLLDACPVWIESL